MQIPPGWRVANRQVLRNVTRVVDPQTGQPYKVQSGRTYYWIDTTRDVIAGTNIPYKPTWDFRERFRPTGDANREQVAL